MKQKTFQPLSLLLYLPAWLALLCLSQVGDNAEPFGLAFLTALCLSGLNPYVCGVGYFLSSLIFWEWKIILCYLVQALLSVAAFTMFKKARLAFTLTGKEKTVSLFPPFLALALGLAVFLFLPDFQAYPLPFSIPFLKGAWTQKAVVCAVIFLSSVLFSLAVYALTHKLLKCRLRVEELLFSALLYVLTGIGFCRFFGFFAYLGAAVFLLLAFCHLTKDGSGVLFSFVLSLPCTLLGNTAMARFFILAIALVLFCRTGKIGLCLAALSVLTLFAYVDGALTPSSALFIPTLLSALIPAFLFLITPSALQQKLENELIFYREKHLARISVNLSRAAAGGQLFELSALFKEIQTTFSSLSCDDAEKNARAFIVNTVWQECCQACPSYKNCQMRGGKSELQRLVEVGCMKGRTSLIDMTDNLASLCDRQSDLLYSVNRHLTDFKRFMLESENAASGRELLAAQAQGVSEILKNLALEQSQPLTRQTQLEKELSVAFLKAGVVCTEIMICGDEEDFTLSLITYGNTDIQRISAVAKDVLKTPLMTSKRISLSRDKCCFILRKRPYFDAAFGVAGRTKEGEKACGDAYSVLKIDERRFIVALADGMGSGEYAQTIASCTLSLLESFYRAKMPPELILSTINKLLSFGKEESFTCVDIGVVDLDNGKADVVKIGSPTSFILSEKSIQVLESSSLPLGILDSLRPDCVSYPLKENDVILFVSDGISSAFGSTTDLCNLLKSAATSNPQLLADSVLDYALQKYGDVAKDDMTVVAVRLYKAA
ncbi:MAG: SpoIIE family protein phosphatase [Clostridia bacterium]|nr:SpoIIE family protein phosphatase [Clostridia bacterium]